MHFVFFHSKAYKINISQPNFFPSMPEVPSFTICTHVICFQSFWYIIFRPVLTPPIKNRHELSGQPNITNQCNAANILHKIYDKNSIIECELITYALDNIVRIT